MANVTAVTLIKQMTYRGDATEEWSNKYYLTGIAPTTPTDWKTLFDELIAQEKTLFTNASRVIRAYGYNQDETDTSPDAVASFDYLAASATVAGTLTIGTNLVTAGDQAGFISWKTSRLSSPGGKPIYLRKYYHSLITPPGSPDSLASTWITAAGAFATLLQSTGTTSGRFIRSRLHAETFLAHRVSPFITTRTLHRRGRRP